MPASFLEMPGAYQESGLPEEYLQGLSAARVHDEASSATA